MIYFMIFLALILSITSTLFLNGKVVCYSILHLVCYGILNFILIMEIYSFDMLIGLCLICVLLLYYSFLSDDSTFILSIKMTEMHKKLIYDQIKKNNVTGMVELIYVDEKYKIKFLNCPIKKKVIFIKDINFLFFEKISLIVVLHFIFFLFMFVASVLGKFRTGIILVGILLLYGKKILRYFKEEFKNNK